MIGSQEKWTAKLNHKLCTKYITAGQPFNSNWIKVEFVLKIKFKSRIKSKIYSLGNIELEEIIKTIKKNKDKIPFHFNVEV